MPPMTPTAGQPAEDDKTRITNKLFHEIQAAVTRGEIALADKLRDRLLAVSPMSLSEIVKSAEIIEKAKTANFDKEHLAIWDKLYEPLSEEERNCLFYSMKRVVVPRGKVILAKGSYNSKLFFIDKGAVTICFPKGDKHIVLAELGPGEIIGEYTFATISLCSATAVSHSEVSLWYLESQAVDGWEHKQPGLHEKIVDFCLRYGRVDEIIRRKKMEKRTSVRYSAVGRVVANLLTREGKKTEVNFRGSLSEISVTGSSFAVKISKKETARALLARHLLLTFSFEDGEKKTTFSVVGKVVAVSFHLYNDYTVHICFNKPLAEAEIQNARMPPP